MGDLKNAPESAVFNGDSAKLGWRFSSKKNLLHVDIVSVFLIGDICWSCHGGEPKSAESTHSSIEAL